MTNKKTENAKNEAISRLKEKLRVNRYYLKQYDDECYFFDSEKITEEEFDKNYELEGYNAYQDSIEPKEVLKLLNRLSEENESLKAYNKYLSNEKMLLIKEKAELKQISNDSYTTISSYNSNFLKEVKETEKQDSVKVNDLNDLFK